MYDHKNMYIYIFWFQSMKKCNRLNNGFIPDVFLCKSNRTVANNGAGTAYPFWNTWVHPLLLWGLCCWISNFLCSFLSRLVAKFEQKIQILRSVNNLFKKFFFLLSKQCSWYIGYNWWLIGWSWLLYQILHHYKPIFSCLP